MIPFVIFLIVSIVYSRAANYNKSRRNYVEAEASNNCFCFPKSLAQAPIKNIIDPNNNGLERLVVFFYRDLGSHVITMYTPAKDKQNLIPDIPFETGDTLNPITIETVAEIFDSNPNVACVNDTHITDSGNQSGIDAEAHESISKEDDIDSLINNEIPNIESVPFAVAPSDMSNQFPIDEMLSYNPIHTDSEEISNAWLFNDHNNNFIGDSDVQLPAESKPVRYNDPIDLQPEFNPSMLNSAIYNSNININSKDYVTFDKWFADQMAKFNALNGPTSANTIDIYILKALIEKTLQENNIYVSVDGALTDAHGTVLDFSNLMLRPILIGDLVAYQNVLKETNKFTIPKNSPYLEALLITLVNPPKVLGIIPLGLAVLPSQFSSSSLPIVETNDDKNTAQISSTQDSYLTQRKLGKYGGRRIIPGYLKVPNNDKNSKDMGHTKYSIRKVPSKNSDFILRKAKAERLGKYQIGRKISTIPVNNDDESDDSNIAERLQLRNILKSFYQLLTGAKKENKDQIDDEDSNEDVFSEDVEEKHNFRIIGGNAATSSGTPINNKGRSGVII